MDSDRKAAADHGAKTEQCVRIIDDFIYKFAHRLQASGEMDGFVFDDHGQGSANSHGCSLQAEKR